VSTPFRGSVIVRSQADSWGLNFLETAHMALAATEC
jgi:hypothetical protein